MVRRLEKGQKIVVATHNAGKLREISQLIEPFGFTCVSAAELGLEEPVEDGTSFEENAKIKAMSAAKATNLPALSDDSGIEVDAIGKAPGIYSADWAQTPDGSRDFDLAVKLVETALQEKGAIDAADRTSRFVACLCLYWPDGHVDFFKGEIEGTIVWPPRGNAGFGYDPIFQPEGHETTFGEMTSDQKHGWSVGQDFALSHRARAFKLFAESCLSE